MSENKLCFLRRVLRRVGVPGGSGSEGVELLPLPLLEGELGGEEVVELRLD